MWNFSADLAPANSGEAVFMLKEYLVSLGAVVYSSGDGITYFPPNNGIPLLGTGDGITIPGGPLLFPYTPAAGALNNAGAWFRLKWDSIEWCVQRTTAQGTEPTFAIKYSLAAGFVGGSPSATEMPNAADEAWLIGGSQPLEGGGFGPFFDQIWRDAPIDDGDYNIGIAADDAEPHVFVVAARLVADDSIGGVLPFFTPSTRVVVPSLENQAPAPSTELRVIDAISFDVRAPEIIPALGESRTALVFSHYLIRVQIDGFGNGGLDEVAFISDGLGTRFVGYYDNERSSAVVGDGVTTITLYRAGGWRQAPTVSISVLAA